MSPVGAFLAGISRHCFERLGEELSAPHAPRHLNILVWGTGFIATNPFLARMHASVKGDGLIGQVGVGGEHHNDVCYLLRLAKPANGDTWSQFLLVLLISSNHSGFGNESRSHRIDRDPVRRE